MAYPEWVWVMRELTSTTEWSTRSLPQVLRPRYHRFPFNLKQELRRPTECTGVNSMGN
ncbi:hypothetical protein M404DRAFT_1006417 [Pisolithus tinctorius Marx 270]|uniref:Uncharacterized protein n=1 Tax=Pisolithus tinctorius Marx 270 TaxID=870435 RepID=A0A0C3NMT1_PISTI|nr:hypothetical protein M404DRAFT_1006417 [Pisolithus tinctorius Marx 270]